MTHAFDNYALQFSLCLVNAAHQKEAEGYINRLM